MLNILYFVKPTVVPTTSARMESQTTSASINNSNPSTSEQASDAAAAVTSSQPSTVSEPSTTLTSNSMTGTSTGGMCKKEKGARRDSLLEKELLLLRF